MKILFVNKFLHPNGGSETYIFELGKQFSVMGHQVQYFGMQHENRIVGNHAESYIDNMDFHGNGLEKLLYPFKIIYSLEARKKIRKVLDDFEPDVVHLNNINFQITPSIIYEIRKWEKRIGRKVKIIFTAHDYQWVCPNHMMIIPSSGERCFKCKGGHFVNCTKNRCLHNSKIKSLLATIEAVLYYRLKTYEKVDTIICPSQFMEEQLKTYDGIKDKLMVLHNFMIGDKKENSTKDDGTKTIQNCNVLFEKTNRYVLYFGRFSEEKGIRTLLQVCKELSHIPFKFAGGGPLEAEVSGVSNVENCGFLQGEELRKLISEASFSVFTSEWYENCPFSVMESQWYGTPIIASDIGGVPELVQDGITGELYRAGDATQLKDKILALWNDENQLSRYRDGCTNISYDSVETYCSKLIEVYKQGK